MCDVDNGMSDGGLEGRPALMALVVEPDSRANVYPGNGVISQFGESRVQHLTCLDNAPGDNTVRRIQGLNAEHRRWVTPLAGLMVCGGGTRF